MSSEFHHLCYLVRGTMYYIVVYDFHNGTASVFEVLSGVCNNSVRVILWWFHQGSMIVLQWLLKFHNRSARGPQELVRGP